MTTPIPIERVFKNLPSAHRAEIATHLLAFFPFDRELHDAERAGETNPAVLEGLRQQWSQAFGRLERAVESFVPDWELVDLLRKLSLYDHDELKQSLLSVSQGGGIRAHCSAHRS